MTRQFTLAGAMLAAFAAVVPASAANDASITRMALCQDSWFEWTKSKPRSFETFRDHVMVLFAPHDNDRYWLPKGSTSLLGMHVAQAFPESVGMGVGFSLMLDAPYDQARAAIETSIGKKLAHCENGDGMKSCELEVAPQRAITLMAEDSPKSRQTLIGCYYFYEK